MRAPLDLNQIVRHALETVQHRIDTQMLDLELDLALDPLPVNADATRLEQVIWNLLSNAVKFTTPERGRICVSTRLVGDYCQVEVSDNGIGIKPDLLPVIFNRFLPGGFRHLAPSRRLGDRIGYRPLAGRDARGLD